MALHAVLGWLAGWGVTMECRLTPEQAREWGRESLRKNVQAYCRMHHMLMLAYSGKTVLIEAERFIGVFDAYEDALEHGYSEFNLGPFFVHVVEPIGSRPEPFIESQHWPRALIPRRRLVAASDLQPGAGDVDLPAAGESAQAGVVVLVGAGDHGQSLKEPSP